MKLYRYIISILLLILVLYPKLGMSQERYLHYTEIDGLPRNITTALAQDKYGYLWIGTANGIARFDGKNFYKYSELASVNINHLLYDSNHNLWASSGTGLYKYNRLTNTFEQKEQGYITRIREDEGNVYYLMMSSIYKIKNDTGRRVGSVSQVSDFCFSKKGLWISKDSGGVELYDRQNNFSTLNKKILPNKVVSHVEYIDNKLLAGCYTGQLFAITENLTVNQIALNNHYFYSKFVKIGTELWIATDGNGIFILNEKLQLTGQLKKDQSTEASINSNSIKNILPGKNNEIWVASYGAGLTCVLPDKFLFRNILPEKGNLNSLVSNEGLSIAVNDKIFCLGTNYGLSLWDTSTRQFNNLSAEKLQNELKGNKVTAVCISRNKDLWIGTYEGLMGKYTLDGKFIKAYHPCGESPDDMQQIIQIKEADNNNLLILTQFFAKILLNFDPINESTKVFELDYKGSKITYSLLNTLRENQKGELLAVILNKGLYHINLKQNVLENKLKELNLKIGSSVVDCYQGKNGIYWIASTIGLIRITEDGKSLKKFTIKEGLPTNLLERIESVDDRYLWVSTISGIFRFDTRTEQILNFKHFDGLPANEFYDRASAKTADGKIIFGSLAGFTIIDPTKVNPDAAKAEVIISDITFQNQSIRNPTGKQILDLPLEDSKEIWLPYSKNSFSIHFFPKNQSFLKYHNYAYRLKGLEKEWNYLIDANSATYTNLNPGRYIFEIKTSIKAMEGKTTQLIIHIRAPWYLSWYAYLVYIALVFTILYLAIYSYLKRMELRQEKEFSDFKIQKEHELTEQKIEFFTNISHDLKTPLTLIDAPVNDLLQSDNLNHAQMTKLLIISRNSKRLYRLISDLIDFRKINHKQMVLEVKASQVSQWLQGIADAFAEECSNKRITLECSIQDSIVAYIDDKKVEKIVWNLLSNAIKFTPKGGIISLLASKMEREGKDWLCIVVKDTGIGISESEKDKIFDRFYKVKDKQAINREGTGIGLAIVKELTEMHHGQIQVDSQTGVGSTFTVHLPCDKANYLENEIVEQETDFGRSIRDGRNDLPELAQNPDSSKQYNLPNLLIVEDNQELREYLADHFEKKCKVYTAEDGLMGLKLAKEIIPDILITDVQMPNMNGYELCKELRRNFDTSHIPIIMLTAVNTVENQVEGLSTGADIYLTKPFNIKVLDAQIISLLENRRAIRNKFLKIEIPENLEKNLPQKDIEFIQNLKQFIEENIINTELNVDFLAKQFAVSLAQFHRKIKSLAGTTPNNLIKSIRLKKAYYLIKEEGLRVSEAAYQTGFTDPNYFTICFKKEFGENPSQIISDAKQTNETVGFDGKKPIQQSKKTYPATQLPGGSTEGKPLLLIAEDNEGMQRYVSNEFQNKYKVITASDGDSAYNLAIHEIPDIIISDIMMPGIDGIELCRRLKTDDKTCHIPIVLLTAKNTDENTLEGLENGADDYISKPFKIEILKARVKNLYQSRLLLRSKFVSEPKASPKEISHSSSDERFLKKAYEIVEKYIASADFDVQQFSSELGMSRAQLYRKIDAISGQSVNEFIRIVRLKKAAELLLSTDLQVSEIAEKVGFNSFAYFSKSFKDFFGVSPLNYKQAG
jgi:DNA-binding response OmpR family regulator/signal transduction histidine kinase/ligand-binding sensor domain-containing protein